MTEEQIQKLVEAIGTGVGDGLGAKIVDAAMTCIAATAAIARQPSIDLRKLIDDYEMLIGPLGEGEPSDHRCATGLLQLLYHELSTRDE